MKPLKNHQGIALLFVLSVLFVSAANAGNPEPAKNYVTPTRLLSPKEHPRFSDDLDFKNLTLALSRQIKRYQQKNLDGTIQMGNMKFPLKKAADSLQSFLNLTQKTKACMANKAKAVCLQSLNEEIRQRYHVFVPDLTPQDPRYNDPKPTFFTGYYTPLIKGSLTQTREYQYPIYAIPQGSLANSTRGQIDFKGALRNRNLELFFARDLFELYLLHVEGGGKVEYVENGKTKHAYISFAGTNKQPWNFISKYMIEKGYITNGSVEAQKRFLQSRPELQEEIYSTCPSYVYFKVTDTPPLGNDNVPLTDGRSIATDRTLYTFKGLLAYVETERLDERNYPEKSFSENSEDDADATKYKEFSRFYLDQDTGGAIKGKARVDLYHGEGRYAEAAGHDQRTYGKLYFLMLK